MTFAIAGRCPVTGALGVAVTTSSIAVGARCPWAVSGVGAVSTQNVTDPMLGPHVLDLLADGMSAEDALVETEAKMPFMAHRQLIAIDMQGRTAAFSGAKTLGVHGEAMGENGVAAGNLLANTGVPQAVVDGFQSDKGKHLADHLIAGLLAGLAAGGEEGALHSAALVISEGQDWHEINLRVDWTDDCPIRALRDLWAAYAPQKDAYVTRALNPDAAPSFGVPGDA